MGRFQYLDTKKTDCDGLMYIRQNQTENSFRNLLKVNKERKSTNAPRIFKINKNDKNTKTTFSDVFQASLAVSQISIFIPSAS